MQNERTKKIKPVRPAQAATLQYVQSPFHTGCRTQGRGWSAVLASALLLLSTTASKAQSGETAPGKAVPQQPVAADPRTFHGVVLYPAPTGIASSPDYSVSVNGRQAFVYNPKVKTGRDHPQTNMGVCYFDCADSATVTVHANVPMSNVVIRPKSYGIKPVINGQNVTFAIRKTQKVTIEPGGYYSYSALVIFANALETNPVPRGDPNVIYFGPGLHTPGEINLLNNQTLYLAGGAVVRGHVYARGATNISILGHGIIDQSLETTRYRFINLINCSNITINGPILLDNIGWCVTPQYCAHLAISDLKEICWRSNTDGIDVVGCSDCTIDHCYLRNWDDGVVLKSFNGTDVHDVTVQNCIFWSDLAEPLEIGYELETGRVDSVTFTNIDIIHAFHNNALSIHNSAQAVVSDIRYQDIRIEDLDPLVLQFGRVAQRRLDPRHPPG